MPANTARLALPYPIPDDTVDVPRDVQALATKLDPLVATESEIAAINTTLSTKAGFTQGAASARPAAGVAGRIYYATDTGALSYDNGTAWWAIAPVPPIVTSLPASPLDGQEVYFNTGGGLAAVLWHLRYASGFADGYGWQFVGGAPLWTISGTTQRSTQSATYVAPATDPMSIVLPAGVGGIFDVTIMGALGVSPSGTNVAYLSYSVGATAANDNWAAQMMLSVTNATISQRYRHSGVAAGATFAERIRASATTVAASVQFRRMLVEPVRVG